MDGQSTQVETQVVESEGEEVTCVKCQQKFPEKLILKKSKNFWICRPCCRLSSFVSNLQLPEGFSGLSGNDLVDFYKGVKNYVNEKTGRLVHEKVSQAVVQTLEKSTVSSKQSSEGGEFLPLSAQVMRGWDPELVKSAGVYMDHPTLGPVYKMDVLSEQKAETKKAAKVREEGPAAPRKGKAAKEEGRVVPPPAKGAKEAEGRVVPPPPKAAAVAKEAGAAKEEESAAAVTPPWRAAPAPGPKGGSPGTTGKAAAGTAASPGVAEAASPGVAKGTSPGVAKGTGPGVATATSPGVAGKGPGPAASPGAGSPAVASTALPAATGAGETPAAVPRPPPQAPRTAALEARLLSLRRVLLTVIRLSTDADQTLRDLSRTLFAEDARVCRDDPYQDA